MKNISKRLLASITVVAVILCSAPLSGFVGLELPSLSELFNINAEAATYNGTCGYSLNWTFDNSTGTLTISGTGAMYDYEYSYNRPWESYKNSIKSIAIKDRVTTIGYGAFSNCYSLTSVTIGNSVATIGDRTFFNCDSLASITVDKNNQYYSSDEYGVLFNKDRTILIQYPIGNVRKSYTIPDSVATIDVRAFSNCDSLTSVTIGNSVTTIGDWTFSGCTSLTSVTIGNSVTSIGDDAFFNCTSLTSITIPDSVATIGDDAFSNCDSLTSVTIGNSVTTIGDWTFSGCTSLTSITIPDSVATIGDGAFRDCTSLTSVTVDKNNQYYSSDEYGVLFNKDRTILIQYIIENVRKSYTIPDSVTTIGDKAFYDCASLTSITIPDSVATIGDGAFRDCTGLTSVTIGNSVTTIGDYAFYDCDSLTSVTIPDSVTTIGTYAFYDCDSLTSVTISDSVTTIGTYAFYYCARLTDVYYTGSESEWNKISIGINNSPLLKATFHFNYIILQIPKGKYAVKVVNSSGEPIKGATVITCDSFEDVCETVLTDSKGIALFNKASTGTLNYDVMSNEYESYTTKGTNYSFNSSGYNIVILYTKNESALRMKIANYRDTDANYNENIATNNIDLLSKTKRLSMTNDAIILGIAVGHFKLTCSAIDTSKVKTYQLWQGEKMIAECLDGVFKLKILDFNVGRDIYVKAIGKDNSVYQTPINLEICKDESVQDFKLSFGDKISFSVDSSVPFVGGTEISCDIPNLPLDIAIENGKVYVSANMVEYDSNGIKTIAEQQKERKELIEDIKRLANYKIGSHTEEKINRFLKEKKNFDIPALGKVTGKFFGAGECEWSENGIEKVTLNLCLIIDASIEKGWQTMVSVVPVTVNIKIGVEGKLNASGSYDFQARTLDGDIQLNISPYLNAFGGVGVGKVLSVGAYGGASVDVSIQLVGTSQSPGLNSVDISGELGIKAYFAFMEYKKSFARNTWHVYTRTKSATTMSTQSINSETLEKSLYNQNNYAVTDTSYLKNESDWLGDTAMFGTASVTTPSAYNIETLLSGTYRNSQPVIASNNSNAVMAFIGADTSRNTYNLTRTMYSVYDSSTSTWSKPIQVDANATADTAPYLYWDGNDIWLVYQESSKTFENEPTLEEFIASQRIVVTKFDDSTKTFVLQNTFDVENGYCRMPKIVTVDGIPYVTWVSSTDSDIFGQGSNNSIMYSTLNNGTWTAPAVFAGNVNTITEYAVGNIDSEVKVVYIKDNDNQLATTGDLSVVVKGLNGSEAEYNDTTATGIKFAKLPSETEASFVWLSNNKLVSSLDGITVKEQADIPSTAESYSILSDRVLFTFSNDENSQIWTLMYDEAENKWCECVETTKQDKYIEHLSATEFDNQIFALMTRKNVTISENNVDDDCELSWTKINDNSQARISDVYYLQEDVKPNQNLPISVNILNSGSKTLVDYAIKVVNGSGEIVATLNPEQTILSGDTAEFTVNVPMGNTITLDEYTVVLYSESNEFTKNEYKVKIGYPDFTTEIEIIKVGQLNVAAITVTNIGSTSASGILNVTGINNEEFVKTAVIDNLAPSQNETYFIDIPNDVEEDIIKASVTVDGEEYYTSNNNSSAYVYTTSADSLYETILIEFDANGGSVDESSRNVESYTSLGELPMPTRLGYTFLGWFTEIEGGELVSADTMFSEPIKLYAYWDIDNIAAKDGTSTVIDYNSNLIYGIDVGTNFDALYNNYIDISDDVWLDASSEIIGTGTKLTIHDNQSSETLAEYTILIFGDVNGDGWYDGQDAVLVSCIVNGMLAKEDVGEAAYMAADCNHDGIIDESDVALLNEAGSLLSKVDQTKPTDELMQTASYIEYTSLIEQDVVIEEDKTPNEDTVGDVVEDVENTINTEFDFIVFIKNIIKEIIVFIQRIFNINLLEN